MRLLLVSVGRTRAGPERELIELYSERAAAVGRGLGLHIEYRDLEESRARRADDRRREEAKAIRAQLGTAGRWIAFDESGKNLASADFAAEIGRARDRGVSLLALVVGGPDGLDPELRAAADLTLAFGAMTWPHRLVRVMAGEQIYRALAILAGHPYHRA